jgi:hypothetical protein
MLMLGVVVIFLTSHKVYIIFTGKNKYNKKIHECAGSRSWWTWFSTVTLNCQCPVPQKDCFLFLLCNLEGLSNSPVFLYPEAMKLIFNCQILLDLKFSRNKYSPLGSGLSCVLFC